MRKSQGISCATFAGVESKQPNVLVQSSRSKRACLRLEFRKGNAIFMPYGSTCELTLCQVKTMAPVGQSWFLRLTVAPPGPFAAISHTIFHPRIFNQRCQGLLNLGLSRWLASNELYPFSFGQQKLHDNEYSEYTKTTVPKNI